MPFCKLPDPKPNGTQVLSIYDSKQDDYCLTNFGQKPEGGMYTFKDPLNR